MRSHYLRSSYHRKETNMGSIKKHSEMNQGASPIPFSQILEAVAKGVEFRLVRTVVVNMVTFEIMCIAKKLHIPEEEIQEWQSLKYFRSNSTDKTDYCFLQNIGEKEVNYDASN
jgi:hypothetical protein